MTKPANHTTKPATWTPRGTPVLLLWLLLVNTIVISILSWLAVQSQLAETEVHRAAATQHALAALGSQLEQTVYESVQEPMLLLHNLPLPALDPTRLDQVRAHFPTLRLLVLLDGGFIRQAASPVLAPEQSDFISAAVQERVLGESLELPGGARPAVRSFTDGDSDPPTFYTFAPAGDAASGDARAQGWLVFGFDIAGLSNRAIAPLLEGFVSAYGMRPVLRPPDNGNDAESLSLSLGGVLSGWHLEVSPATAPQGSLVSRLGMAWIAASIGLVIAVALISFAIVWAVRREHALVNMRNRFVSGVSHELKTPLSLIRMYAETLYLGRLRDPERIHEYHRVLLAESERLSQLIGNVLDFGNTKRGEPVYRLVETDLGASVTAVLQTYLPEWRSRGAQVEVRVEPELPAVAHDAHGILQILLNLVDNAIKYGGAAPGIEIDLVAESDGAQLTVCDHGPGMDAGRRQRLWRALQQGRMNEEAEGSGLGLALVKQIVDAHHAALVLDTGDDGRGLCVRLSFPRYTGAR